MLVIEAMPKDKNQFYGDRGVWVLSISRGKALVIDIDIENCTLSLNLAC